MGCHGRNKHWFTFEMYSALSEAQVRFLDVLHFEVKNRAGMIQVRPLWDREHQPNTVAIEESHSGRHTKQVLHPKDILVESRGPIEVVHID